MPDSAPPPPLDHPQASRADRDALRRFNRFATAHAGALNERYNALPFSLPEARALWELRHGPEPTAARIAASLAMDPAYLSRLLSRLRARGLVADAPGLADRRARPLALTAEGEAAMDALEAASDAEADRAFARLPAPARARLRAAMAETEALLSGAPAPQAPILLRPPRPGDMGWVISRHGALYAREFGWSERFEALVARICADWIEHRDPRDRGWIAERDGDRLGAVFLARGEAGAGKLRLLFVEPEARGTGLGRLLVREVIREARAQGLPRLDLWTHDVLSAARGIYAAEGFRRVSATPSEGFGAPTVEEVWSLDLDA